MKTLRGNKKRLATIHAVIIILIIVLQANTSIGQQPSRDILPGYAGWNGDPDSLNVYFDDSWSESEKADLRAAMKTWNKAGAKPGFKETGSPAADVTIKKGDAGKDKNGNPNAGICADSTNSDGKNVSAEIIITGNTDPLSLKEVATHELGHAIGLADTDENTCASDVMRGTGGSNGTDGGLSQHDSTEMRAAAHAASKPLPVKEADLPNTATQPGTPFIMVYILWDVFLAGSGVTVSPVKDPLFYILNSQVNGNQLMIQALTEPTHPSGEVYLDILITPPLPQQPYEFRGKIYISSDPAPRVEFECPFDIVEEGGSVHVNWQELCTYLLVHPLRSRLVIDGTYSFTCRGGGNYTLHLTPGMHLFELYVDDHQVNKAYYSMLYQVKGSEIPLRNWPVMVTVLLIMTLLIVKIHRANK